ncbi:hypothetical protein ACIQTU_06045 [Brevundimonas sp. NPDC090276]|uniref:hypothetical protein n=1 Tax=Brevundimonas sp. NPDC090276 TaxID=3363956 RepID=UPI00383A6AB2
MAGVASRTMTSSWRALATGLAAAFGFAAPVQAQSLSPEAAPVAWVAYAEAATQAVTAWLEEDNEAASSFRHYLHQTRPAADRHTPPLVLKLWIDAQGRITRIDFAPFAHAETDAALRSAVSGRRLARPPSGMLQPLRLSVQLDPVVPETGHPANHSRR